MAFLELTLNEQISSYLIWKVSFISPINGSSQISTLKQNKRTCREKNIPNNCLYIVHFQLGLFESCLRKPWAKYCLDKQTVVTEDSGTGKMRLRWSINQLTVIQHSRVTTFKNFTFLLTCNF